MKKFIAMLLAVAMLLSLCACGSSSSGKKDIDDITDEEWEAAAEALAGMEDEPAVETEAAEKIYQLGEVITSADGMVELTIDSFCFSDYWDESEDGSAYIARDTPEPYEEWQAAGEGKTNLFVFGTLTLVGEIKENSEYYVYQLDLDYNNGYKFSDSKWLIGEPGVEKTGTTNAVTFEPLMGSNTRVVTGYIEIPETIETDTESPLVFTSRLGSPANSNGFEIEFTIQLR